jgi:hypothetical protein
MKKISEIIEQLKDAYNKLELYIKDSHNYGYTEDALATIQMAIEELTSATSIK